MRNIIKNKKLSTCQTYNTIWHGFKLPVNALYGVTDNVPYVLSTLPKQGDKYLFLYLCIDARAEKWVSCHATMTGYSHCNNLLNNGISTQTIITIVEKLCEYSKIHNLYPIGSFKDPHRGENKGLYYIQPKDRNPQRDYLYKAIGRPARIGSRNNHAILFDASQDKPIIRSECYWETGKNDASTSHKKPAAEKPLWENPTKNWGRKGAIK